MRITPRPPYDDTFGYADGSPRPERPRRRFPLRFRVLAVVLAIVLLATATTSTRRWWAHRLHDITGGSRPADFVIGLVVGLLPLIGIAVGAFVGPERNRRGARRLWRMLVFGAIGFVLTDLLAPSLGRLLVDRQTARVFDLLAPGYLAGVLTGALVWLALFVVGVLRARAWWRRATRSATAPQAGDPAPRIIDI